MIFLSHANMAADVVGANLCHHVEVHVHAMWHTHACVRTWVCTCPAGVCVCVCARVINEITHLY